MTKHPCFPLVSPDHRGSLLMTPCPGTVDSDVSNALLDLKAAGATTVVTLMTRAEMALNGVDCLQEQCMKLGLAWIHLPVEDEGAPTEEFADAWTLAGQEIHKRLDTNETVAIHCKGGSGRTGLLAAQILMERGVPMPSAIERIKSLRPNAFIHAVQLDYIAQLADRIQIRA